MSNRQAFPIQASDILPYSLSAMVAKQKSKKVMLKNTTKDETMSMESASQVIQSSIVAISKTNLKFQDVMADSDVDSLRELSKYLQKNKSNLSIKLENAGTFLPCVKSMLNLRDFIDKAISKSCDLIHDSIVSEFSSDDDDFDFEAFKGAVSEVIGKMSGSPMVS